MLTQEQVEAYHARGCISVEGVFSDTEMEELRRVTDEFVERSRQVTENDEDFDLEPGHSAAAPRLRRVSSPVDHHPLFWEFASKGAVVDLAADLVGPDVRYHHSKLNFKWLEGGEEVKWHQDITFWPHTNYSPLTIGVYLTDVGPDQGPLAVVEGSHEGELFNQYDGDDNWVGCLSDGDAARIPADKVRYLEGPAGSVTVHNCRAIHGSKKNLSARGRPLLLNAYSAADAFPYTSPGITSPHLGDIVRGRPARWARHDPRPCLVPPDWSGGYTSIYALQQEEEEEEG